MTNADLERIEKAKERFWAKVEKTDDCWFWRAALTNGYGRFSLPRNKHHNAHRLSFVWAGGVIPKGMTLDHLCRVRNCVRPDHLEVVTNRENILRGEGLSAENARKTHCPRGHSLSGDNLRYNKKGGRICRLCEAQRLRNHRRMDGDFVCGCGEPFPTQRGLSVHRTRMHT